MLIVRQTKFQTYCYEYSTGSVEVINPALYEEDQHNVRNENTQVLHHHRYAAL